MKIGLRILVLSILILQALPTVADEAPIYESLTEVTIGRVFFSEKQRANLDRLRGKSTTASSESPKTRTSGSRAANPDAAGFIVRSSGKSRVYRNGDFVEVASEPDVKFPDDVTVTRKPGAEEGAEDDDAD